MNKEIVYFELNNWTPGRHYPYEEPFISWMKNCRTIDNEDWIKANKLCVVKTLIDMSCNYCITATKEWVENNCPSLLTKHRQFLRFPNECDDVHGNFGTLFKEYDDENIGLHEEWFD